MEISKGSVPSQIFLRAVARAQEEPLHDDIKRMEILCTLMEAVLATGNDLPRSIMQADKGTGFIAFMSLVDEIRDDFGGHACGKSTAYTNSATLHGLGLVFESLEAHITANSADPTLRAALTKSIVCAARDFHCATAMESDDFKTAWAQKGVLPRQSPFTAFTVANEVIMHVMPKIEKSYPDITQRAWGEKWDHSAARKQRAVSAQNSRMGAATADDVEYVCESLSYMARYIAGVRSAFTKPEQIRAQSDMNCRVLDALGHYISPYMPRQENLATPDAAPDNMLRMEDFKRARIGTGPYAPRPL